MRVTLVSGEKASSSKVKSPKVKVRTSGSSSKAKIAMVAPSKSVLPTVWEWMILKGFVKLF